MLQDGGSIGNLSDEGSQGFIFFLVDGKGNSNPLISTFRIKIVKLTLTAEKLSLAKAAENVFSLANVIEETVHDKNNVTIIC